MAIQSGYHYAQPLHRHLGVSASARASLHSYDTVEDIDDFIQALNDTVSFFKRESYFQFNSLSHLPLKSCFDYLDS